MADDFGPLQSAKAAFLHASRAFDAGLLRMADTVGNMAIKRAKEVMDSPTASDTDKDEAYDIINTMRQMNWWTIPAWSNPSESSSPLYGLSQASALLPNISLPEVSTEDIREYKAFLKMGQPLKRAIETLRLATRSVHREEFRMAIAQVASAITLAGSAFKTNPKLATQILMAAEKIYYKVVEMMSSKLALPPTVGFFDSFSNPLPSHQTPRRP